jgi:hypothetical protein
VPHFSFVKSGNSFLISTLKGLSGDMKDGKCVGEA